MYKKKKKNPNPSFFKDPDPSIKKHEDVRKDVISTIVWLLYDFLSFKNDVNIRYLRSMHAYIDCLHISYFDLFLTLKKVL